MAQAAQQSPIAALAESGALPQQTPAHLRMQPAINGGFLTEYFKDVDAQNRTGILVDRLLGLSIEERDRAIKAYKDANKIPSPNKPGKEIVDPVASTRASEVKAVWCALNVAQVSADELRAVGYHKAVALSRRVLNEQKIDPDGETKLSSEERKERKVREVGAEAAAQTLMSVPQLPGESNQDYALRKVELAETAAKLAVKNAAEESACKVADKLVEKYSRDQIAVIRDRLSAFLDATPAK